MSTFDTDNILLREQLGKGPVEVYADGESTGATAKDFYVIFFPKETVVASLAASNVTVGAAHLATTYAAGTTLFINATEITITTGLAHCYVEHNDR